MIMQGYLGSSAWSAAKHYASKHGRVVLGAAGEKALSLADRATDFLRRKPAAVCGCFTAATLVWTPAGAVPIEQITEGAIVLVAPEELAMPALDTGEVSRQIVIGEASLLRLTVRRADGVTETINTTDEHPFHLAESGEWVRADLLQPGQALSAATGMVAVESLTFTADRVPVYNLSVSGSPTYFVGQSGLWVHNCGLKPFPRSGQTWAGSIGDVVKYRADIRIEGKVLQLNNLFVEGDIGEAAYFELLEAAKDQARRQGFKRLEIFAVRSSGASPGTIIERAFDL